MNDLQEKYHGQLAVLGFACNQFHHSDHCSAEDLLLVLRHIQPGNDFYPTFEVFNNVEVNGKNAHPLFRFLRESLPLPSDDLHTFVDSAVDITWSPVCRNDVASNFEKFIVAPNGKPYRRYSSNIQIVNLQNDVQALIEKFKDYKPPEL
ncbi:GPX1 [Bugula neritina]|uniref:Glutathione peroxidase 1 n=1 Tax=Bugula neritina TaxID=10212 RepID=A0A7J7JP73_BUGNE|nr:GPX1 [Bugula neritina]